MILCPKPSTYFAGLRHKCVNTHVRVRVKVLNDKAFLLQLAKDYHFMSLYSMLSVSFQGWITDGEIYLMQWTLEYG
jgi:hypothetical protein